MIRGFIESVGLSLQKNVYKVGEPVYLDGWTDNRFWFPIIGSSHYDIGIVVYDKDGKIIDTCPKDDCVSQNRSDNVIMFVPPYTCNGPDGFQEVGPVWLPFSLPIGEYDLFPSNEEDNDGRSVGPSRKPTHTLHISIQ